MKKFILSNMKKDHEPYREGKINTNDLCKRIKDRAYKLSDLTYLSVEHAVVFEYRRYDDIHVSIHSSAIGADHTSPKKTDYQISYSLDYPMGDIIIGAIVVIYINEPTGIPCGLDLYALTNCSDDVELVYSINYRNYKRLFKMIKKIAEESKIIINDCEMIPINYDDYNHKHFYLSPIKYRIIDQITSLEKISLD